MAVKQKQRGPSSCSPFSARRTAGKGKFSWNHPMMHARGLGDDGPALLGDKDLERFKRIELELSPKLVEEA